MLRSVPERRESPVVDLWARSDLLKIYFRGDPVCVNVEINQRCAGGCAYCYASSTNSSTLRYDTLPAEAFVQILTRMREGFGTRVVYLYGGNQLLHPKCREMVLAAIDLGFHVLIPLAGLISRADASWLVEAYRRARARDQEVLLGIHLDTLDPAVYAQVNSSPGTLDAKIRGYQTLLDAGFPPERTYGCPTLTRQTAPTMKALMDWLYGRGARHVAIAPFRPVGLGRAEGARWEPSLSQIREVFEHRARVEGKRMLLVGSTDGRYACQSHVAVTSTGNVIPCLLLPDLPAGNIFQQDIVEIVRREKRNLLLKMPVHGPCASCVSRFTCCGCRANAHLYLGDITASDPKCFFNPTAPERCFETLPGEDAGGANEPAFPARTGAG